MILRRPRPSRRRRSLRRTLLTWLLLPLLTLMSLGTLVVYEISLNLLEQTYDEELWQVAETTAKLAKESLHNSGQLRIAPTVMQLLQEDAADRIFISILDSHNHLVIGDGKLKIPQPDDLEEDLYYDTQVDGAEVRALKTSFRVEVGGISSEWTLLAGETRHKREDLTNDILLYFLLPQGVITVMAAVLVIFGIRHGLRPLDALAEALARRSHNDVLPLHIPRLPEEIQPIVQETNSLLDRLKAVFEAHKHFAADAAHQLRTPLAGIAAQTDFAREQPNNPPLTQHALDQIKQVLARLNHTVNQLLSIARNEPSAEATLWLKPTDLNTVGREAALEWVEHAVARGIDLGFSGSEHPVMVQGDADRLKEMLGNLIDNALRYCPHGSSVTVQVWQDGRIGVEDNGPGIPADKREQVFERFHRLAGAETEGSGLGLAIVREIAALHSATIRIEDGMANAAGGRGALFLVQFLPSEMPKPNPHQ